MTANQTGESAGSEEGPVFAGGDGNTPEDAVIIKKVGSHAAGIRAEKEYLSQLFGVEEVDWELKRQSLWQEEDGTRIDELVIEKDAGGTETIYFDITNFFGMEP